MKSSQRKAIYAKNRRNGMEWTQWKNEMRNNSKAISSYAERLSTKPENITRPDIKRLESYVGALKDMYGNLSNVKPPKN